MKHRTSQINQLSSIMDLIQRAEDTAMEMHKATSIRKWFNAIRNNDSVVYYQGHTAKNAIELAKDMRLEESLALWKEGQVVQVHKLRTDGFFCIYEYKLLQEAIQELQAMRFEAKIGGKSPIIY